MAKKNEVAEVKNLDCLNCGYPFFGNEQFCPECGQKNKNERITFVSFLKEIFNGFISWDAKFWTTLFPLITKPGKVSKDYIEGKRARYTNPFRFYLTTSIVFFLIVGLVNSYNKFQDLRGGTSDNVVKGTRISFTDEGLKNETTKVSLDSIQEKLYAMLERVDRKNDSLKYVTNRNTSLTQAQKDSVIKSYKVNNGLSLPFGDSDKVGKFLLFHKKHPNMPVNKALDSLKMEQTFGNRFWYSRTNFISSLLTNKETSSDFTNEMFSYSSIAFFILLPIFTLFLKLLYVRRKMSYVEHLIFVFHVQTVFFLLYSLFYLVGFISKAQFATPIFLLIFLVYLFLAMKRFYGQGFFKTLVKYCIANAVYFTLAALGTVAIMLITFAIF